MHDAGGPREALLSVSVTPRGPGTLVVLEGRLDGSTGGLLSDVLRALLALERRPPLWRVEVDLGRVSWADAAGTASLELARATLAARGGQLELRRPSRSVRRVLDGSGLTECVAGPALEVVGGLR